MVVVAAWRGARCCIASLASALTKPYCRFSSSKIPEEPYRPDDDKYSEEPAITSVLLDKLERLALVGFEDEADVKRLSQVIKFADKIRSVDTADVEPMETLLEDRAVYLREDKVTEGDCREQLLKMAPLTIEDYYVAPPGNIPLKREDKEYPFVNYKKKETRQGK